MLVALAALALVARAAPPARLQDAVDRAMRERGGTLVVLDLRSNQVLAAHDFELAARRLATPGSTVKTFVLLKLLETGKAKADERYLCPRRVLVGRKRVDCTHPALPGPLDPPEALAWSCNAYFATAARRLSPPELRDALARAGLASPSGITSAEATGQVTAANTPEQLQLQALGDWGVMTTPLALLAAYRALGERRADANVRLAWAGMEHSVAYGMARAAHVEHVNIAGKTGTAAQPGGGATHGWFVALAPAEKPEVAIVVYLEPGRGVEAAAVAQPVLAAYFQGAR
jgi:cell division protein FtsI/penicillin-binding protein 2